MVRTVVPKPIIPTRDDRYEYDVFISYRRHGEWPQWVGDIFLPLFANWLGEELGRDAMIFIDNRLETGVALPESLTHVLVKSRVLVPLWTSTYFSSAWCIAELAHMLYREKTCGYRTVANPSGLVVPAILHGGADYPPGVQNIQAVGLQQFVNLRTAPNSPTAEALSARIKEWIPQVASAIYTAPPWEPEWEHFFGAVIESLATTHAARHFLPPEVSGSVKSRRSWLLVSCGQNRLPHP